MGFKWTCRSVTAECPSAYLCACLNLGFNDSEELDYTSFWSASELEDVQLNMVRTVPAEPYSKSANFLQNFCQSLSEQLETYTPESSMVFTGDILRI
jgi:hypothetical protein